MGFDAAARCVLLKARGARARSSVNHPLRDPVKPVLPAADLIAPDAAAEMADEIRRSGGNEVFFLGTIVDGRVAAVTVLARGNKEAVPAIMHAPAPGDAVLHNHPSGGLEPSDADLDIASALGANSVAFYIVDNAVEGVYPVVHAFRRREMQALADGDLNHLLQPGSALAAALPSLEDRPGQHAMLSAVAEAFNAGQVATLEAGTGTGKTLAYLLPAAEWAKRNREKVVVATHTINLQEQIVNKDAPALRAVYGDDLRVVLVKGRSNYVSLRRARELEQSLPQLLDDAETAEAKALLAWARATTDGSKSDLPFLPKADLWEKVQSETDNCLRLQCPTFQECHFFRARRAALEADLLVANHHLVFADLSIRAKLGADEGGLLPAYKRVVFDEAHHIEEVATEYFGSQVTRAGFTRALSRLSRDTARGERGSVAVLLKRLEAAAGKLPDGVAVLLAGQLTGKVRPARLAVELAFQQFFDAVHLFAREGESDAAGELRTLRLTPEVRERAGFAGLQTAATHAVKALEELVREAAAFLRKAGPFAEEIAAPGPLKEFSSAVDRLAAAGDAVRAVLMADSSDVVRWLETKQFNARIVRLIAAPLEVGPLLKEHLFEKHATVVLTSATLAVSGSFQYLQRRTGLAGVPATRRREAIFPSPFDFARQARLFVATDLPPPDRAEYEDALAARLPSLLAAAGGRAFVLFTSFRSLERQFRACEPILRAAGIRCLKQGETGRDKLLKLFRDDVRSVLFGTDSFWEGVDVEGEALSTVVLTRLPFRVPTEPILVARAEALEAAGGRAFGELTIPMAVIKFRQGFGRLIRNKTDRGVVVVTDNRIVTRPYGKVFLNSLPPVAVYAAPLDEVERDVAAFFAAR